MDNHDDESCCKTPIPSNDPVPADQNHVPDGDTKLDSDTKLESETDVGAPIAIIPDKDQVIETNQEDTSNSKLVSKSSELEANTEIEHTPVEVNENDVVGSASADNQNDIKADTSESNTPEEVRVPNSGHTKKKVDDKLSIYKALAIKLKKELVKTRDDLQRSQEKHHKELDELREKLKKTEETLKLERVLASNTNATLEATIKSIRLQLESAENDLQNVQSEFENYKTRASQIMQQNNPVQTFMQYNKGFEEDRYKQIKQLNEDYKRKITDLTGQLSDVTSERRNLERELRCLKEKFDELQVDIDSHRLLQAKCEKLSLENETLKVRLQESTDGQSVGDSKREVQSRSNNLPESLKEKKAKNYTPSNPEHPLMSGDAVNDKDDRPLSGSDELADSISHSENYSRIRPAALEIISRSSVLEDAQNQIDSLTKAYLESENTNSLLAEQVKALKEEIRRIQRGNERMDLADNLEYLKNIVLRFLSLDDTNLDQKQRLVPVLSTVLRLSPEETAKLTASLSNSQRPSVTSSIFKLGN